MGKLSDKYASPALCLPNNRDLPKDCNPTATKLIKLYYLFWLYSYQKYQDRLDNFQAIKY